MRLGLNSVCQFISKVLRGVNNWVHTFVIEILQQFFRMNVIKWVNNTTIHSHSTVHLSSSLQSLMWTLSHFMVKTY